MTFDPEHFKQQLATLMAEVETKPGPIQMLNMVRFYETADYRNGEAGGGPAPSGREAYATYSGHAHEFVEGVGGVLTWMSAQSSVIIGPKDEPWDAIFAVRYPNRAAFVEMVTNPDYQAITHHRTAAVADSRLIMMEVPDDNS